MKVLATYSIKGGVGKTSTAVNLSFLAAREGRRTLLWDLDPQGSATYLLRVRARIAGGGKALVRGRSDVAALIKASDFDRLDVLPADFSYRHMDLALDAAKKPTRQLGRVLSTLRDDFDVVVLDCPPSVSLVSENVIRAADVLLVPLLPAPLSVRTLEQLTDFIARQPRPRPTVVPFCSMVDRRKRLHRDTVARLTDGRNGPGLTTIPNATLVEQMSVRRAPIGDYAPDTEISRAYESLWREVADLLDAR